MKTVAEEEDRGKNLMVFGLKEEEGEGLAEKVDELFSCVGEKPCIRECVRVGKTFENKNSVVRPVKSMMRSPDNVY